MLDTQKYFFVYFRRKMASQQVMFSSHDDHGDVGLGRGQFNEEWFWVFGYGTAAVVVIVANIMVLCAIGKNAFLHTITHRYNNAV